MSYEVIDKFFKEEAEQKAPKKHHRNSRAYLRRMFYVKEKESANMNGCEYFDNTRYIGKNLEQLIENGYFESNLCKAYIVAKDGDTYYGVIENKVNHTVTEFHTIRSRWSKKLFASDSFFGNAWIRPNLRSTKFNKIYFKHYYVNDKWFKDYSNNMVSRKHLYDYDAETGECVEVAPPKGSWYKKVFDYRWEID